MLRIVLDTNIFVRALLNRRSVWAQLVNMFGAEHILILSQPILAEVEAVLVRPELRRKYDPTRGWNKTDILAIARSAELVVPADIPATCRDPNDDKFLATALSGRADYLVSEDNDLLVLERFGQTRIVNASTFLNL